MTNQEDPLDLVLSRLYVVRPQGSGWMARCPRHDDRQASLKVDRGDDGRVLIKCHAGCKTEDVLREIGLTFADLRSEKREPTPINRSTFVCAYDYHDENGVLQHQTVRFANPKRFSQRRPDGNGGWIWSLKGITTYLYRYPELLAAPVSRWVFVCEGEKDADRLAGLGFISTTNPMGAEAWKSHYTEALKGRRVVLLADNDPSGEKHVAKVAAQLHAAGVQVRVLRFTNLPEKGDVSDWLDMGHTADDLKRLVESTPDWSPAEAGSAPTDQDDDAFGKPAGKKSQATQLVELAEAAEIEFWHTPAGDAYASVRVNGHIEHHPVRSQGFKDLIAKMFFEAYRGVPGGQAMQDAINHLSGVARFDGDEHPVFVRHAWHDDVLWVDLGRDDRRAARIDGTGWQIVESVNVPVKFRRTRSMSPLPLPEPGGSFDDLYDLFDLDENGQMLTQGWVVAAFQPQGARAHLELCGQQGSGKTTFLRMLIRLIDPSEVDVRSMPKDEDALVIAVSNRTALAFDNISHLSSELADAYCRISTGGGLGKRVLFTDTDELLISVQIPLAWTGINSVIGNYADLQDRTVTVTLQPLDEKKYRSESDLWACYAAMQARLLGCLYDALSTAIRRKNDVHLTRRPRLADFTEWVEAAAAAFDWEPGEFFRVLTESRESASELAVESSPIGDPIVSLVKREKGTWTGTATELLDEIRALADDERRKLRGFPKQANQLSNMLKRLRPALLNVGIQVDFEHSRTGRSIILRRTGHERARQQAQLLIEGGWAQVESLRADLAMNGHLSPEERAISEEALAIAEAELRKAA